jgi:hypothetical protein
LLSRLWQPVRSGLFICAHISTLNSMQAVLRLHQGWLMVLFSFGKKLVKKRQAPSVQRALECLGIGALKHTLLL